MYISDIFGKGYRLSSVNVGCYRSDGVDSSVYSIDRSFSVMLLLYHYALRSWFVASISSR